MATQAKYVRCQVSPGFFDSEFYVIVGDVSALVSTRDVKVEQAPQPGKQVQGVVLAYLVEEERDRALIELPGQAVVGGLRTWIGKDTFTSA